MPLALVHLSDIHFGQDKGGRLVIHDDVKERLIDDVSGVVAGLPHVRATGIIVTGDIAYSGKPSEYKTAAAWLDRVARAVGCAITDIQVVPGNHDVDHQKISRATELMLANIAREGEHALDSFLAQDLDRELFYARFHAYRPFAEGYDCPLDREGGMASDRRLAIAPGRHLRFIGLNSALICSRRDKPGQLILGARQRVLPTNPGEELVILCHHPLHWFQDSDDARKYLRSRARVFISGHEHEPAVSLDPVSAGCDLLILSAGAANPADPGDAYNYTYNVIEFDRAPDPDGLNVRVHPRMWSDEIKAFIPDPNGLGRKDPLYTLGCPNFRRGGRTEPVREEAVQAGITEAAHQEQPALDHDDHGSPTADEGGEEMPDEFPLLLLRFFRDLSGSQRLRVLVKLGAMPPDWQEPLTHTMERRALDSLKARGQLDLLKKAMDDVEREG